MDGYNHGWLGDKDADLDVPVSTFPCVSPFVIIFKHYMSWIIGIIDIEAG